MDNNAYLWRWRAKLGERFGQPCTVTARGRMNTIRVDFPDGFFVVVARTPWWWWFLHPVRTVWYLIVGLFLYKHVSEFRQLLSSWVEAERAERAADKAAEEAHSRG